MATEISGGSKAAHRCPSAPLAGSPAEVFAVFLKLGLTSFGGPVAHLGYFRDELVARRRWIDEAGYADLVAMCHSLPGPASSQVGYALGLWRAGPLGGAAAWCAFTLPSAALLVLFAMGAASLDGPVGAGLLHGLKLVAVAVDAQAVWGMARAWIPDWQRAVIALAAVVILMLLGGAIGQVVAIVLGGLAGLRLCRTTTAASASAPSFPISRRAGAGALLLFLLLLAGLPLASVTTGL